jgi:hypothetical protein
MESNWRSIWLAALVGVLVTGGLLTGDSRVVGAIASGGDVSSGIWSYNLDCEGIKASNPLMSCAERYLRCDAH